MTPVPGAEHQDIDQHLEDDPVTDPGPVTAERVPVVAFRKQGGELFPDGLNQVRKCRHGLPLIVELSHKSFDDPAARASYVDGAPNPTTAT